MRSSTLIHPASILGSILAVILAISGCIENPASPGPRATPADPPDAAVVTIRSAATTAPASWINHWGSWPLARSEHAMAYDQDRRLTVMFAGRPSGTALFGDTWEWDGERAQWVQHTPAVETSGPPARAGHAMVYDAAHQRTFLFGGWQPGTGQFIADQWEWNSAEKTWHERALTGAQPAPRYGHAMVYDANRGRVVLFGGYGGTGSAKARFNDLWEWDGTAWADVTPAGTKPSPRLNALMVYDAGQKLIVLRGGNTGTAVPPSGTAIDDTWEWDASTAAWNPRTAAPLTGTPLGTHRAVYDAGRGKVVLYQDYQTMWQWEPATPAWTPLTTSKTDPLLPPTNGPGIIYDAGRARVTFFGGSVGRTRDVWEWNPADGSWANRSPPIDGPTPRTWPFLAVDSKRDAFMVFGGFHSGDASAYKQDIWQWTAAAPDWDSSITKLTGAKPSVRAYGPMVYDTIQDRLIIFGGYGGGYLNDLWTWSPLTQAWTTLQPTGTLPGLRSNHWAFHDRRRNKLIAFGGLPTANIATIWELDLTALTWTNWTPSPNPVEITGRVDYDVAYDSDRGKLVLIGGSTAGVTDAAVWEWDLGTRGWALRTPAAGPPVMPGRSLHAIAYDSDRRVVIVVGGRSAPNAPLDDSWEWDGTRATWSETTPPTMRPLPRAGHRLLFDEKRGTALLYGGTATLDPTYSDREIWEYVPNRDPRPDGAPCSLAAAAACRSGLCVDGVCCQAASCAGACRACNVAGHEGACADVPAGGTDDACRPDQACDAAHQCKTRDGQACGTFSDCASGHCADGVCCDSDCNQSCRACNLNNSRGACANVSQGVEDPVGAPACASDAMQGRACDGQGHCVEAGKPNGDRCTAAAQCLSAFCIDGVCCNNACAGTCQACDLPASPGTCTVVPLGQQDLGAATPCAGPMQYCSAGSCAQNKKPNGGTCTGGAECGSGFCADGVCCDGACTGTCQACNLPGLAGRCAPTPAGATDTSATTACAAPQYCNGAGACASGSRTNGVRCALGGDCASGSCSDGVCCDGPCTDACRACNLPGLEGSCALLPPGSTDGNGAGPACAAPGYCGPGGACLTGTGRKTNGAICATDGECGSSNCVDGVCCESACAGKCRSCKNATGTCTNVAGGNDPRGDCAGDGVCGGTCNGQGACRFAVNGLTCRDSGCQSDGYIGTAGICDGAGRCQFGVSKDCAGYVCVKDSGGVDSCRTDCAGDTQCVGRYHCDPSQCLADLSNGKVCDRDSQCLSGFCADGYCCDKRCGACGSCNLPGKEGTCDFTPAGTDPRNECIDSASDPSGKCGGMCNGRGACEFPAVNTVCGTCKVCDGSGKCNVKPEDDVSCGDLDCDQLDTSCRDYRDLQTRRCASLGACKVANLPATCSDVIDLCGDGGAGGGGDGGAGSDGGGTADSSGSPDGGGAADAAIPGDGGGGTKGSGGGCGCAVQKGEGDSGRMPSPLAIGVLAACVELLRRRRRG